MTIKIKFKHHRTLAGCHWSASITTTGLQGLDQIQMMEMQQLIYEVVNNMQRTKWLPAGLDMAILDAMFPEYKTTYNKMAVAEQVKNLSAKITASASASYDHLISAALSLCHNASPNTDYTQVLDSVKLHPNSLAYVNLLHILSIKVLMHFDHSADRSYFFNDVDDHYVASQDGEKRSAGRNGHRHKLNISPAQSAYANTLHTWYRELIYHNNHDIALIRAMQALNSTLKSHTNNQPIGKQAAASDRCALIYNQMGYAIHQVIEDKAEWYRLQLPVPSYDESSYVESHVNINSRILSFQLSGVRVYAKTTNPTPNVLPTEQCLPHLRARRRSKLASAAAKYPKVRISTGNTLFFAHLRKFNHRRALKPLRKLFPPTSATDSKHMPIAIDKLVWALIHPNALLPKEHLQFLGVNSQKRVNRINSVLAHIPVGTNSILASQMLISAVGCQHSDLFNNNYINSDLLCIHPRDLQPILKDCSAILRKYATDLSGQPIPDAAVAQLAYLDLSFGRSDNRSDWQQEKNNRCFTQHHIKAPQRLQVHHDLTTTWSSTILGTQPNVDAEFYSQLRAEISNIVKPLIKRSHVKETLNDFLLRRHEWMASGSASNHTAIVPVVGQTDTHDRPIKVNKRIWSESLDKKKMLYTIYHPESATEVARASEKFENGKSRAIYGTSPEHYVINTYVTQGMEERLHLVPGLEKGASGAQVLYTINKKCNVTKDALQDCCMLDYADFNIHHTPQAQTIIFQCIREVAMKHNPSQDWLAASAWMAASKTRQRVYFPGDHQYSNVTQGMFSGTRSTDLINTILNLAYFRVANSFLTKTATYPHNLYNVHQGDDLWLSSSNKMWTRRLYYTMSQQGFIFQESKQMFGHGRGEFLRVLYSHGDAYGYLQRALVNMLLKPIQAPLLSSPSEWLQGFTSTCKVIGRRGLVPGLVQAIWADVINHHAAVRAHPLDKKPITIPLIITATAPEFGGMGCPPPYMLCPNTVKPPNIDARPARVIDCQLAARGMTEDWIQYVSKKHARSTFGKHIQAETLKEAIVEENYLPSIPTKHLKKQQRNYKDAVKRAGEQCKRGKLHIKKQDLVYTGKSTQQLSLACRNMDSNITQVHTNDSAMYSRLTNALSYISRHSVDPSRILGVTRSLTKIVCSSTFKSVPRTAQALGLSRAEALTYILSDSKNVENTNSDDVYILCELLRRKRLEHIDLLLGGGSSLLSLAEYWSDPNYVNIVSSIGMQTTILAALNDGRQGPFNPFVKYWHYYSGLIDQLSAGQYPTNRILY